MEKADGRGRGVVALGLVFMLLAWCPYSFALNPALDVSQYAHTAWKIHEVFFKAINKRRATLLASDQRLLGIPVKRLYLYGIIMSITS
jgi:hypothetical protein